MDKIKSNNAKYKKICEKMNEEKNEAVYKALKLEKQMDGMREKLQKYYSAL